VVGNPCAMSLILGIPPQLSVQIVTLRLALSDFSSALSDPGVLGASARACCRSGRSWGATLRHMRPTLLLAAALATTLVDATAGNFAVSGAVIVGPRYAPYGAVFPPSFADDSFAPCPALNCANYGQLRRFLDRYERNYGGRFAPNPPPVQFSPLPRDVAPTPEAHIQPRYRGASQLRPEFEQAGQRLDERPAVGQ
jgi:hypothetical protein